MTARAALVGVLWVCMLPLGLSACKKKEEKKDAAASASAPAEKKKLSPELAKKTLAKVGDRVITLGEYEATLERMDPFERMRYQSLDRRKRLLEEMVEVELLAQEARRRGLDKTPETEERTRQILRDHLLEELRKGAPSPNDVPEAELRAYYDKHKDEFAEPERRRVAAVVLDSAAVAKTVLAKALKASPAEWGELVAERSTRRSRTQGPAELAGDLGIVGAPGHPRGANPRVPDPVREAAFKIEKVGDTYGEVVESDGKFYVVRVTSSTPARERKYEASERAIRTAVVQAKIREKEQALEAELRKKFPVKVDEAALAKVAVPAPGAAPAKALLPKPPPRIPIPPARPAAAPPAKAPAPE